MLSIICISVSYEIIDNVRRVGACSFISYHMLTRKLANMSYPNSIPILFQQEFETELKHIFGKLKLKIIVKFFCLYLIDVWARNSILNADLLVVNYLIIKHVF